MPAFRNDAFLWYNVPGWDDLGLAVPNYGNDKVSQNASIRYLVEVTGRNLAAVMWQQDARTRVPPTINTIRRVHKLCTRARDILAGRAVAPGTNRMEPAHAVPSPEAFLVYPTPYFLVRNNWLKDYACLILTALTEAIQHSENSNAIEISTAFAGQFGQYIQRVYKLMATELLKVPVVDAMKPDFTLTEAQLTAYDPFAYFTSTELIDTVPNATRIPTEDDLEALTNGIPTIQMPVLGAWPTVLTDGGVTAGAATSSNPTGASFAPAPGA